MRTLDPAEVCDRAFGEWTRDTPTPKWLMGVVMCWSLSFPGPMPEWWIEPRHCEKAHIEPVHSHYSGGGDA